MMSLCRRTAHNLLGLGFPDHDGRCRSIPYPRRSIPPASDGRGLRCFAGELPSPPAHVVESASVSSKPPCPPPLPSPTPHRQLQHRLGQLPMERIDDGTRGLDYPYDRSCGGGGGLELCTESLGFESCCDGRVMGEEEEEEWAEQEIQGRIEEARMKSLRERQFCEAPRPAKARSSRRRTEAKEFPPPLSWLSSHGSRSRLFLKAARRDGRLVLTQVQIDRPEVLRAFRRDGHLRLELVDQPKQEAPVDGVGDEVGDDAVTGEVIVERDVETATQEEEGGDDDDDDQGSRRWQLSAMLERRSEGDGGFMAGRCQGAVGDGLAPPPFWSTRFVDAMGGYLAGKA